MAVKLGRTIDSPDVEHAQRLVNETEIAIEHAWDAAFALAEVLPGGVDAAIVDGTLLFAVECPR